MKHYKSDEITVDGYAFCRHSSIASNQAQIDFEFLLLKLTLHFILIILKMLNTKSQKGAAK